MQKNFESAIQRRFLSKLPRDERSIRILTGVLSFVFFVVDWVVIFGFFAVYILIGLFVPVAEQEFFLNDPSIQYSYKEDTIPTVVNLVIAWTIVIVVYFLSLPLFGGFYDTHAILLSTAFSFTISMTMTSLSKHIFGFLRPDFIARCIPVGGICTGDPSIVRTGRRSMPSGHVATAFSCKCTLFFSVNAYIFYYEGTYMAMFYLLGKFHLLQDGKGKFTWQFVISFLPNVYSIYVAATRITDNRHHPLDTVVSALLTLVFAYFSYNMNFHALSSEKSGTARRNRLYFLEEALVKGKVYRGGIEDKENEQADPESKSGNIEDVSFE